MKDVFNVVWGPGGKILKLDGSSSILLSDILLVPDATADFRGFIVIPSSELDVGGIVSSFPRFFHRGKFPNSPYIVFRNVSIQKFGISYEPCHVEIKVITDNGYNDVGFCVRKIIGQMFLGNSTFERCNVRCR
jgi:hypothetical protein